MKALLSTTLIREYPDRFAELRSTGAEIHVVSTRQAVEIDGVHRVWTVDPKLPLGDACAPAYLDVWTRALRGVGLEPPAAKSWLDLRSWAEAQGVIVS